MNPWEKYASQEGDEGPWLKYQVPPPPSGIPEQGPSIAGEQAREMGTGLMNYAKQSALPTVGSIAVPTVATATFGPANIPFIPLEQGIGSALGETANQALGITDPSLTQIGLAFGTPLIAGYGANLLRTGKALPSALQTAAPKIASDQISGYASSVPSKDLFDIATKQGSKIPLQKTQQALQDMATRMTEMTPASQKAFEKVMKDTGLIDAVTQPGGITPSKMQSLLADMGKLQSQAAKEGGLKAGYLGKFFGSLSDDLEAGGPALATARQAFKRESVLSDIQDAIANAMFIKKGQGMQMEFSANKVLNTLNKTDEGLGKWFVQSFTPKERVEIKSLFGFLNELPTLKPGAGQQFGSGRFFERITKTGASGSIGAGIGYSVGGPTGAMIGGGLGIAAHEASDFGRLVLTAWKMPGGRQVVKQLLTNSDAASTPYMLSTLAAFVTSAAAKPAPARHTKEIGTLVRPFPQDYRSGAAGSIYDYPPER